MHTENLWSQLEPLLKQFGVEIVPGEPGGFVVVPQYPDPVAGTGLGDEVWRAIDAFKETPLTDPQMQKVEYLLECLAKVVRYRELAYPLPKSKVFNSDAFQEELRHWPVRKPS